MKKSIQAHVALFIVALIYGANYTIAKVVMDDDYLQPLGFIMLRVVSALFLFWVFHLIFVKERINKKDIGLLALCGLFGVAINQMFFFMGLDYTTPINASLIMTTTPMLVLIASFILIKERITNMKILGILLGAGGAVLLITYGQSVAFTQSGMLGDVLIFINACSYGIYLVLVKPLMRKYHPLTVIKWVFTFGLIFVFPFGLPSLLQTDWSTFTPHIWLAVLYVLIFTSFLAYLLNAFALKTVSPATVSIYIYLQPLLATVIALSLAKDVITIEKIIAGILIFVGVYLVSK